MRARSKRAAATSVAAWPIAPTEIGTTQVWTGACDGRPVTVVMLALSRALWAEPMDAVSAASVGRVLVHAVRYFGGVPRVWRFDPLGDAVARRKGGRLCFDAPLGELARCCAAELIPSGHRATVLVEAFRVLRGEWMEAWLASWPPPGYLSLGPSPRLCAFFDRAAQRRHPFVPGRTVAQMQAIERAFLLPEPDPGLELRMEAAVLPRGGS